MKYLIVSDSHGMKYELYDLVSEYHDFDGYIHCGDSELDKTCLEDFQAVLGNTDYNGLPLQIVVPVGNKKALVLHSHKLGFQMHRMMAELAKQFDCDFVFFGHTHCFFDEEIDGIRLMNPGSLHHSRDNGSHSFAVFEIDEEGNSSFTRMTL